jgi:hypothetical protein
MSEIKEDTSFIPRTPPEKLIPWMREQGCFNTEYIIYRAERETVCEAGELRREKVVECTCTACQRTFHMPYSSNNACHSAYSSAPFGFFNEATREHIISGDTTLCPYCSSQVNVKHIGSFKYTFEERGYWPLTVHNLDGRICLIVWCVYRTVDKQARVSTASRPYEAYVFEGKKCAKYCGYYKYFTSFSWLGEWERRQRCEDNIGKPDLIFPFDKKVCDGTVLENSKLYEYCKRSKKAYPITYLRMYQKHPNIENLIVQGCTNLLNDMISKECCNPQGYWGKSYVGKTTVNGINWKEKRPAQMLGLTREEFRRLKEHNWSLERLEFYITVKSAGFLLTDEELNECFKLGKWDSERILTFDRPEKAGFMKSVRYVNRQKVKYSGVNAHAHMLTDYWDMSRRLGDSLATDDEIYPQNLKRAHDGASERFNESKTELRKKEFKKRYRELKKYIYENDTLIIIPPKSEAELRREGKSLHHCVSGYAEKHARGDTAILFIRHKTDVKEPYFTLELDERNIAVRQNRGNHNCDRTEEVVIFEAEFIKHLKELRSKKK